jgi:hypothetical protein
LRSLGFIAAAFIIACVRPAMAQTYLYDADCAGSYSKQGEQQDDLTKQEGKPIACDSLVVSMLENGHVLVQIANKGSDALPLGFGGDGLDYKANPNFITLPLQRIYLPHAGDPAKPNVADGIEGYCFLDAKTDLSAIREIDCAAKMELGTGRKVYSIKSRIIGKGQTVP